MTSNSIMIKREPVRILDGSERSQKRQKPGAATDVMSLFLDIGMANYDRGDYQSAEECFSQAMNNVDISCPTSRMETALKNNILNRNILERKQEQIAQQAGRKSNDIEYDEGMRVYTNLVKIHERDTAEDIAATLCYNLAQTYAQRGLYKDAIRYIQNSLHKFTRCGNNSHDKSTRIVMALHCLGYCLYRTGNEGQAKDCYEQALSIASEHNLGTIHLAASLNCVGVLLFNQRDACDIAMEMFRKSLELYKSSDHSSASTIATILNNIGRVHYLRFEYAKAHNIYEECLQMRENALGAESIDFAATAYNLGQTCNQLGRLDDALSYYKQFLDILQSVAGSFPKDTALVYRGIGEIYQHKSNCKMALHYFQKALDMQRACSQDSANTDTAATLNKMGNLCYEMKDFTTALRHYRDGLCIEKELLPPNHPHIIITITNIGHIHKQLGEFHLALAAYTKVHQMQRTALGDDNFVLADTMSSMGLMQYHLRNYEASFDSYQEALRIRREHLGSDEHPEIASTLNSIGLVLFKQEDFQLAKSCFSESLRIRSKLLGKDHRDVAILWYNIATIHFETGEDELAIQMYKETLRVERHALGEDHPDVAQTLQHLGQVHQQLGHTEEAIGYFQEALDIERRRKDPVKRSLARVLNMLGNVYLQLGRTSKMMACYEEAARIYESNRAFSETLVIGGYNFYGLSKINPPCAPMA